MEGEHETRTKGLFPSSTATTNVRRTAPKHATGCRHRHEPEQNRESGVVARPTTSPLPSSRDVGVYTTDELVEKDGEDNRETAGITPPF